MKALSTGAFAPSTIAAAPGERHAGEAALCALFADASLSVSAGLGDAAARLDSLGAALAPGPDAASVVGDATLLGVAHVFERAGDHPRALATLRRRNAFYRWPHHLAAQQREEGRLRRVARPRTLGRGPGAPAARRGLSRGRGGSGECGRRFGCAPPRPRCPGA